MKTVFIEARYKKPIRLDKAVMEKLPKRLGLISTAQFVHQLEDVKGQLEAMGKEVHIEKGFQRHAGQILGCDVTSAIRMEPKVDAFLYIGDGVFHPIGVSLETSKDVYTYNPILSRLGNINKKDVENYKKRKKAGLLKFHSSTNIGVLVSTKAGQCSMNHMPLLRQKYPDKKFYIFVFGTLDLKQLESFPFIEAWVNTACPRIDEDLILVNTRDVL